jgi:hypothetical protein
MYSRAFNVHWGARMKAIGAERGQVTIANARHAAVCGKLGAGGRGGYSPSLCGSVIVDPSA